MNLDRIDELLEELDAQIAEIAEKRKKLQSLREAWVNASDLIEPDDCESSSSESEADEDDRRVPKSRQFLAVQEFFESRKNAWADTSEISQGTDLKSTTIRQLLYARYQDFFESRPHPNSSERKQFRVKQSAN